MLLDVNKQVYFAEGLPTNTSSTTNGAHVAINGRDGIGVVVCNGTATGWTFKLQQADKVSGSPGTWADCVASGGDVVSVVSGNKNVYLVFDLARGQINEKDPEFIRVVATKGSGSGLVACTYALPYGQVMDADQTQGD